MQNCRIFSCSQSIHLAVGFPQLRSPIELPVRFFYKRSMISLDPNNIRFESLSGQDIFDGTRQLVDFKIQPSVFRTLHSSKIRHSRSTSPQYVALWDFEKNYDT